MTVDRAKALTANRDGHTYHFCSEHCRAAFEADEAAAPEHAGTHPAHAHR